jgi:SAM-dependent methyltransferase
MHFKVSDSIKWHIDTVEKNSERDAVYIDKLIRKFLGNVGGIKILDMPCGNGRLHSYLRNFGYDVCGIDISKELIDSARQIYRKYSNKYKVGDMRNASFGIKFDVLINWFSSFGYFNDEGNKETLANFNSNLKKGGLLLIETANYNLAIANLSRGAIVNEHKYKDVKEVTINYLDPGDKRFAILEEIFYNKNGVFIDRNFIRVRLYSIREISKLLKEFGFKIMAIYESWTFNKADKNSKRITFVSRKI